MEMSVVERNSLCVSNIDSSTCRQKGARGVWQCLGCQILVRHPLHMVVISTLSDTVSLIRSLLIFLTFT